MMSLNPALDNVRYCPRCGAEARITYPRSLICPKCSYGAFYNPKPVAATIPCSSDDHIWLLRRAFDPGGGLWTFPGGFVDLGESVEQAAARETLEELEIEVRLGSLVGVYSQATDRVVLIVFSAQALATPQTTAEATEVRAFSKDALPWEELAFWSTAMALRDLLRS
jgi:8-oxo-dGTP diphosphatase